MWCLLCLDADRTGKCVSHLEHGLAECQAHAGGKEQVVLLEAGKWIAEKTIAVSDLPTEPVFQFGRRSSVELKAVGASLRDVRVNAELFGERSAIVELGVERFAENDFAGLARNSVHSRLRRGSGGGSEERLVIAASSKSV